MKSLVFVSVSVLLCMGCSHSRFVLHDPARGGSAEDRPRVEVSSKDRLSIFFRADGGIDSTCAVEDGDNKPVTVNAIEADMGYLLLSSEEWKTVRQIPRRYISMSGLRVRSPNSVHDEPTVALPLASIEEIRIEDRDLRWSSVPERLEEVPRWFLQGAVGGFTAVGSFLYQDRWKRDREVAAASSNHWNPWDRDDREFLLAASVVGGVGGAVLYPAARLFWPESRKTWRSYRPRGQGFRLEFGD